MKVRRKFDIDIIKLSNSIHNYEFDIDSSFFEQFEDSFIEKGNLKVQLILDKSETMIQTKFQIDGEVELICDRSLEPFNFEVIVDEYLVFKYGEEFSELTEEIITIPKNLPTLNFAQYIYEFIGLAVPMKKLHPRFQEEENEEEEDEEVEGKLIYTTIPEGEEEEKEEEENEGGQVDPRWEILNNIKKNLN